MGLSQCGGDDGFTSAEVWVLVKSCDLSDLIPREVPFWDKEGLVRIKRSFRCCTCGGDDGFTSAEVCWFGRVKTPKGPLH
eukprot:6709445-Pyramimonas_sp.AAC.1